MIKGLSLHVYHCLETTCVLCVHAFVPSPQAHKASASNEQELFAIITCSSGFAIGFGLHLFSSASPKSYSPLSFLMCKRQEQQQSLSPSSSLLPFFKNEQDLLALGLLLHVNKTSLPSLYIFLLLFLVLICIFLFGVSSLLVLLPSFFFYVQEARAATIIIMFIKCVNLFTITTFSCDFSLGFGLHLFSSVSPYSLTPLFVVCKR